MVGIERRGFYRIDGCFDAISDSKAIKRTTQGLEWINLTDALSDDERKGLQNSSSYQGLERFLKNNGLKLKPGASITILNQCFLAELNEGLTCIMREALSHHDLFSTLGGHKLLETLSALHTEHRPPLSRRAFSFLITILYCKQEKRHMIPFTITDAAAKHISKIVASQNGQGLKIGLKKGGCAGMEYSVNVVNELPKTNVVTHNGAHVVLDPMAEMFLFGTELDYKETLLESGFVFKNPNVTSACGCGESISFDAAL